MKKVVAKKPVVKKTVKKYADGGEVEYSKGTRTAEYDEDRLVDDDDNEIGSKSAYKAAEKKMALDKQYDDAEAKMEREKTKAKAKGKDSYDDMTFGKAFDAAMKNKEDGQKTFTWRGKSFALKYGTDADSKKPSASVKPSSSKAPEAKAPAPKAADSRSEQYEKAERKMALDKQYDEAESKMEKEKNAPPKKYFEPPKNRMFYKDDQKPMTVNEVIEKKAATRSKERQAAADKRAENALKMAGYADGGVVKGIRPDRNYGKKRG